MPTPFLDLSAVKDQLKITSTGSDAALTALIGAVQDVVERHTGQLIGSRAVDEELMPLNGVAVLRLGSTPVTSVQAITDSLGTVYDVSTVVARPSGILLLPYVVRGSVTVSYTAGLVDIPASYLQAGYIIVQHLWETRRGNMPSAVGELQDGLGFDTRLGTLAGYAIPRKALELLGARAPVVA